MRRLRGRRPAHPLARLREERGAVAVMVALLMPVLFGAAAIAIDTAGVWSARQQVETGADAAVLAVAMDCAEGSCGDIKATSEAAFWANDEASKAADLGPGQGLVTVSGRNVSVVQTIPWVVNHYFAAVLGQGTGQLSVQSYAQWAPAVRGVALAPVGISYCDYVGAVGSNGPGASDTATLPLKTSLGSLRTCTGASGAGVAAVTGTALTVPDRDSACRTTSAWKSAVKISTSTFGNALGSACTSAYLSGLVGQDVLVPVWSGTPSSTAFTVYGYAAFHVTGAAASSLSGWWTYAAKQVDDTTPPATNAPDLGARSVFLTSK